MNTDERFPAAKFAAVDCLEPWQVLLCLPKDHIDKRGAYSALERAPIERPSLLKARLLKAEGFDRDDRPTKSPYPAYVQADLAFEDCTVKTRFYRASPYMFDDLIDCEVVIEGIVHTAAWGRYIKSPLFSEVTGRIEPIYSGLRGQIGGDLIAAAVEAIKSDPTAWGQAEQAIQANRPVMRYLEQTQRSPRWVLDGLHRPRSLQHGDEAVFLARMATIEQIKSYAKPDRKTVSSPYNLDADLKVLVSAQAETLSHSQRIALNAIRKACNVSRPANILLNGDVGSGKTLVFLLAIAAVAVASKGTVAVMVPSDLVARQIHQQASSRFPNLSPCLVVGDSTADSGPDQLKRSRMLIGTQALLSRHLPELQAVVVDEQHKFSVEQRRALLGPTTHVIEASATPIPRTLALALFDGWTYALIEHSPVEKKINSHVIALDEREQIGKFIKTHLQAGRKAVFLYPSVNGKGSSVLSNGKALSDRFPGLVSILHGKLKPAQKIKALESFRSGQCPIIVASTAIEVGVDVPDVGLMVVTGADRFGASQLHQLRGRLVRNGGEGDFVMIAPKKVPAATRDRLAAVAAHGDGFALAQKDLELRGFGELLGEMQTGNAASLFKLTRLVPADFFTD